jgi:hypothetical protein
MKDKARKPSKCDRCSGVFNPLTDELAYFGSRKSCQTCGAGAHWERGADSNAWAFNTPPGTEYVVLNQRGRVKVRLVGKRANLKPAPNGWLIGFGNGPDRRPDLTRHAGVTQQVVRLSRTPEGFQLLELFTAPDDTGRLRLYARVWREGTLRSLEAGSPALELFEMGKGDRNYGRKRSGVVNRWYDLGGEAEKVDSLRQGGWHVRKEGTTGRPVGRPATGIRDEDNLIEAINAALAEDRKRLARAHRIIDHRKSQVLTRSELRALREEIIGGVPSANTLTVAELYGITRRAARNLVRSPNSPKGGESMSTLEVVDARLARIENLLLEHKAALEQNSAEVFETLYAFRFGETPAEAWERVLLDDAA